MRKGWEVKKLGEICLIERGGSPRPIEKFITDSPDGLNWIKIGDTKGITKYIYETREKIKPEGLKKTRMVYSGDFILSNSMSFGRPYIMRTSGCIHDGWLVLRPLQNNIDAEFLYYILTSPAVYKQFDNAAAGSTVRNLNSELVRKVEIPLPPLSEQKHIVAILDEAFAAIDKAKENAETNLQNAKELFESYLQEVFENKGKDWEEKKFEDVCILQRGFDLPTRLRNNGDFPLVSSNGITDRINVWKVKSPGVVTGRSGTIGSVHYVEEDFWPLNTALYIKDFFGNSERFIYYLLRKFDLSKFASGAGVPTLNRNNVHCINVWVPKYITEQEGIVKKLDSVVNSNKKTRSHLQTEINRPRRT